MKQITLLFGVWLEATDIAETFYPFIHLCFSAGGKIVGPVPALVLGLEREQVLVVDRVEGGQDLLTLIQVYAPQALAFLGMLAVKVLEDMRAREASLCRWLVQHKETTTPFLKKEKERKS